MAPPVDKAEVDEVWLGFTVALQALKRDGHVAKESITGCALCYAAFMLENAERAYLARGQNAVQQM